MCRDWQRSRLNETARAFLSLGDYRVLDIFRRDGDQAWAEELMGKVFGPTWKQRVEKEKEGLKELANSKSPIETGGNKKKQGSYQPHLLL